LERGKKGGNATRWWLYFSTMASSINSPRDILVDSASNAFGEGAAHFRISSESVTAYHVFEQVIFDDLNV
jgi:hypothetical protein